MINKTDQAVAHLGFVRPVAVRHPREFCAEPIYVAHEPLLGRMRSSRPPLTDAKMRGDARKRHHPSGRERFNLS